MLSRNGCEESAQIPLTSNEVPWVLSHSVIRPGTPPVTMSVEFDSSASFIATGPLKRCQETLKSFRPRSRRIFLDQPVALHDVELQVAHRELFGQPDLRCAGRRRAGDRHGNRGACDPYPIVLGGLPVLFSFLLIGETSAQTGARANSLPA